MSIIRDINDEIRMMPDLLDRVPSLFRASGWKVSTILLLAALVIVLSWLSLVSVPVALILSLSSIWILLSDAVDYLIPDTASIAMLAGAVVSSMPDIDPESFIWSIGFAVLVFAFFWSLGEYHFRKNGVDGLGIGDAKLAAVASLYTGPILFSGFLWVSAAIGILIWISHVPARQSGIAFGAIMITALPVSLFVGSKF